MGFAIDYNDLATGVNDIQGERSDALKRSIDILFEDTLEDWESEVLIELEKEN